MTPGLRVAHFDRTAETYVEPRASFGFQLSEPFRLKGGWGKYTQVVNRIEREDFSNGNQEFWTLSDGTTVPAARATHYVGGLTYEKHALLVDAELFYKSLEDLTTFAPRLRPGDDTGTAGQAFYHGSGTARGLELLVQKKAGRHTGWLSYTLSQSEETFPTLEAETYPVIAGPAARAEAGRRREVRPLDCVGHLDPGDGQAVHGRDRSLDHHDRWR